jgi:hypothetical protein
LVIFKISHVSLENYDCDFLFEYPLVCKCPADQAFQNLKNAFTMVPILIHLDFSKPFFLESDASGYALGAVLSQNGDDERLHPTTFHL